VLGRVGAIKSDRDGGGVPLRPIRPRPVQAAGPEWQAYLIEAWALGCFMMAVGVVVTLLEASSSPLRAWIQNADIRRVVMAAAMGVTATVLIYSPWGRISGAHMNPAVTLAFLRLGKITPRHALGYSFAQISGGLLGVYLVWAVLGSLFSTPPVSFATTVPGSAGVLIAFLAELLMSTLLMLAILESAARPRLAPYTGLFAGFLVFAFISIEAPLSGTSINPARSIASAVPAQQWTAFWLYLVAPVLGMQLAAALFAARYPLSKVPCAKLCHSARKACIHCGFDPNSKK
jgi:aquaporin Z